MPPSLPSSQIHLRENSTDNMPFEKKEKKRKNIPAEGTARERNVCT